jgi:hypothetical protein
LFIFREHRNQWRITARPNEPQRHVNNLRERVSTALGARPFFTLEERMANRAMNAKLQRARTQARDAAALEFTKPAYILQTSKHELRALAAAFDGAAARRMPSKPAQQRRSRSYGDGPRRGSLLTTDVYATESRLIRSEVSHG